MIARLIKFIADTIIHGYALHSIYDFSVYILGSFWNSVTQLLLQLGARKETKEQETKVGEREAEGQKDDPPQLAPPAR